MQFFFLSRYNTRKRKSPTVSVKIVLTLCSPVALPDVGVQDLVS